MKCRKPLKQVVSMFPTTIIKSHPKVRVPDPDGVFLRVSEFFCDTIQGENFVGFPAAFLRLQECTLNCRWCDTQQVWKYGNPYTITELLSLMDSVGLPERLHDGQRLVFTGGSPLNQQNALLVFLQAFMERYAFKPYIEVENECTLLPNRLFSKMVDCWNNSPKLSNAGNPRHRQYRPAIIKGLSLLPNSWFKFVVSDESEWEEIEVDFLKPGLVKKQQIVLMPLGGSLAELEINRPAVVQMALKYNVRYSTREHVVLWDKLTGV